jgi:hypothetical protein
MDKALLDRLLDPTFNSCRDDEEFNLAWTLQSRIAQEINDAGGHRAPPKDRLAIRRRQAAEREADERLREQRERVSPPVHSYEEDDDPALALVKAEVPDSGVRRDGWTADRRIHFLELLEEHGSILAAARAVGMSRRAVYRLLPRAPAFAAAFEAAMSRVTATLADTLFDRALHGHEVPVMHAGDVVATRTVHHDMLGLYLLRVRDPLNYASPQEGTRWLAGHGLKPIGHQPQPAALTEAHRTAVTGDLCDLREERSASTIPATGDLCDLRPEMIPSAGSARAAAGDDGSSNGVAQGGHRADP